MSGEKKSEVCASSVDNWLTDL